MGKSEERISRARHAERARVSRAKKIARMIAAHENWAVLEDVFVTVDDEGVLRISSLTTHEALTEKPVRLSQGSFRRVNRHLLSQGHDEIGLF